MNLRQQPSKKPDPDRFAIKSGLLDSELQFKKGKALMEKGNYKEALTLNEMWNQGDAPWKLW